MADTLTLPHADEPGRKGSAIDLGGVIELLRVCGSVLVVTHRNPDGDAVGSATALARALRRLGKVVRIVCPDPLPDYLLAVPDSAELQTSLGATGWDLIVSVDVSDPALLTPLPVSASGYLSKLPSLNIDHHASNLFYARYNYVDADSASAAELIHRIILALALPIDREMAEQLLYGIVNDTHSFQNSNTTPTTLRVSADLVEIGADLSRIVYELLLARRVSAANLWAQVLPTLHFADHDRVAMAVVTQDALANTGAEMSDTEGLVEFLRSIRGVDLAVLLKQTGEYSYRLSTRTTPAVDAVAMMGTFGGGGHLRAAGADIAGPLADVEERILAAYRRVRQPNPA